MPKYADRLDRVFHSLADPTRRAVIRRLARGPVSVTTLAKAFDMRLPSFTQHMSVLERDGLVESEKVGRVRTYRLKKGALKPAEDWLSEQRRLWESRLNQLDALLEDLDPKEYT